MENIIGHEVRYSLPEKLEDFIFNDLLKDFQGKLPDYKDVRDTLKEDETEVKGYLAKYFPRSFVEAKEICKDLFNAKIINETFKDKKDINILDIGSGSGGNLMGLLYCLKDKIFDNKKNVWIVSIDGNKLALKYQERMIKEFFPYVLLRQEKRIFKGSEDFRDEMNKIVSSNRFDVIMCFQFVNEFYRKDFPSPYLNFPSLYFYVTKLADKYLEKDGLFILSDVTEKIDENDDKSFIPKLMNYEIFPIMGQPEMDLKCVIPLSCAFWYEKCSDYDNCFQQKIFNVYYKNEGWFRDRGEEAKKMFKFVYKIFAHKNLAGKILSQLEKLEKKDIYKVSKTNFCYKGGRKSERDIPSGKQQNIADAFTLSSLNEQNEI